MPEISPMEIMVVAIIALIVFGPEKLPEMARKVGNFAADLRRVSTEVRGEFHGAMRDDGDTFDPEDDKMTEASEADEAERAASSAEIEAGAPEPDGEPDPEASDAGQKVEPGDGAAKATITDVEPEGPIIHKRTRRPRAHEDQ